MFTANRRGVLVNFAAFIGAPLVAPLANAVAAGAANGFEASQAVFTEGQRALAASVSERIVPTTDTPGAIAAGVPGFIEMMLADWYAAPDRSAFLRGLEMLDATARARHGMGFSAASAGRQDAILTAAMTGAIADLAPDFFEHCRQMVLLGYYSSEIGCTVERIYVPVPGHYDGAYPYAKSRRIFSS